MEDEFFKIIAAEIVGECVTESEKEKIMRWRGQKSENEKIYKMMVEELGDVVKLVKKNGGMDREKAYERLEKEIQKKRIAWGKRNVRTRSIFWWKYAASVASLLLLLSIGVSVWMRQDRDNIRDIEEQVVSKNVHAMLTLDGGEVVLLKHDTNRLILVDTTLQVVNERNALVYSEMGNKGTTESIKYNMLTVLPNCEYQLVLADGTKVFLNSGSEIRYPEVFIGNKREIFLKGEAWFEVAKDSKREFRVHVGEISINVLGTSFNVNAYESLETVATTLVKGSVEVSCAGKSFRIVPGEQFVYDKNTRKADVRMVDTEEYTSWKDGYYKFRQATLEEIMTTLSVWYGVNLFYQNENVKQLEFTGKVKRYENIRTLLDKFEQTENVVFDMKGNSVFVKEK